MVENVDTRAERISLSDERNGFRIRTPVREALLQKQFYSMMNN